MTLNKLTTALTGMFVTGSVFFIILLRRAEQMRQEIEQLKDEIRPAA